MLFVVLLLCFSLYQAAIASGETAPDGSFAAEIKLGQYSHTSQEAIYHYTKAIEIDPGRAEAYSSRAKSFEELHEYQKALKDFNQAVYLDPNDAELLEQRAYVYEVSNRYALAIKDCDEAIKIKPDKGSFYFRRAMSELKSRKYENALRDFIKSNVLEPNFAAYHYQALLHKMQGKHDLALIDLALAQQVPANGTIGAQSEPTPPVTDTFKDENGKTYPAPWGGLLSKQMLEQEYFALKLRKDFDYYDSKRLPKYNDKLNKPSK